ncbi:tRNA (adenosine(37)-N6)-dimethylallyltransferase MiaA [Halobacteriovorax marinus]|uniref:tRNA dimethylallyltransferase n=1 Tax=Halobacteriovorax marinus TaxID=97084 RepID=A0A1Y5F638_9BACT|nr:tRNA (adenosine(37)-N6)-dimethylallyltransferase MiaA [Halobacteriovorax marinus]
MKKNIIIISGPTASGKTSTSIRLCRELNKSGNPSAIVNFDSLVFYRELNIGTAKPTNDELSMCEHHLVGIQSAKDPINASDFLKSADELLESLTQDGKIPIFTGGSAFYIRAFVKGMYDSAPVDQSLRNEVQKKFEHEGIHFFRNFLKEHDPKSYETLHENDHYRNLRAYEHFISTNSPISEQREKLDQLSPYDFSINRLDNFNIFHIYLDLEKDEHWKIILDRSTQMVKEGLVEEVRNLLANGFTGEEKPLKSIGYKETIQFINGEFKSTDEYIERMAISTRQLAKSQRTFFKKVTPKNCFHPIHDQDKILKQTLDFIGNN